VPYGMQGGDTPTSDSWMERCVTQVKASGKDEQAAIRICKAAYTKHQAQMAGADSSQLAHRPRR
jgi:hypothetical protein